MKEQLQLKNHLKEVRTEANLSQAQLAEMVGVSRNTISSIETGQFNPTAKLALILCIALGVAVPNIFARRYIAKDRQRFLEEELQKRRERGKFLEW